MELCKDRLYCDAKDSLTRRGAQSAMYLIAKSMLALVAPVLTYTADEIVEHSPEIFKQELNDIFDIEYSEIPETTSGINEKALLEAREKFFEEVDRLKKEKIIKTTLELNIVGDSSIFNIEDSKNLEDWFGVSGFVSESDKEPLATFKVDDREFKIIKSPLHKCPRCWRFSSEEENKLCKRCEEVVNGAK